MPKLPPAPSSTSAIAASAATTKRGIWSQDEHDRFLDALKVYPHGPWASIAKYVGTRSARQVQTHAQKYYEKIERRVRGLQRERRSFSSREHRIEDEALMRCVAASVAAPVADVASSPVRKRRSPSATTAPACLQRLSGSAPFSPIAVDLDDPWILALADPEPALPTQTPLQYLLDDIVIEPISSFLDLF